MEVLKQDDMTESEVQCSITVIGSLSINGIIDDDVWMIQTMSLIINYNDYMCISTEAWWNQHFQACEWQE